MKEINEITHQKYLHLTKTRTGLVALLVLGAFLILLFQVLSLQVIRHQHFATLSHENRLKIIPIAPIRGEIYSKDHILLAGNLATYSLITELEYVPSMPDFISRIQKYIALDENDLGNIEIQLSRKPDSIQVKGRMTEKEVAVFSANRHQFPGSRIDAASERYYPLADITSHVIGYVSSIDDADLARVESKQEYLLLGQIGKSGIERKYEDYLKGEPGYKQVEVDAEGRIIRVLEVIPPRRGNDLFLHVDSALQIGSYNALSHRKGAIVAVDPSTGGVLSLVSAPGYDPNLFVRGIKHRDYENLRRVEGNALFNRSIQGQYPPGSTIKPFMALAGLHYKVRQFDDSVWCPGWFKLPHYSRPYRDWKKDGHGKVDIKAAIVQSCDIFFYQLALDLGLPRMKEFLQHFGFGGKTGLDLDGEKSGLLPSEQWKLENRDERWHLGDTVITGIGQGYFLTTPVQLASAVAALAMDGVWRSPVILDSRKDLHTGEIFPRQAARKTQVPIEEGRAWEHIKGAMLDVVHSGTGTARGISRGMKYKISGKTGTVQVRRMDEFRENSELVLPEKHREHALFIAFAPAEKPLIAIAIIVENAGSGSASAAPIARTLFDLYLKGHHEL